MGTGDVVALGLLAVACSFLAFCLLLDPRPHLGGEGNRASWDGLFFMPWFALLGSLAHAALTGRASPRVTPLLSAAWLAGGSLLLGLAMRWLYVAGRGPLRTTLWVAGVVALVLLGSEPARRQLAGATPGRPAAPGAWL